MPTHTPSEPVTDETAVATPRTAPHAEPFRRFGEALERAITQALPEPTAMSVATADAEGRPSVRMILLKGYDERGFLFYTNLGSRKAAELAENPRAALCFHWVAIGIQVRVEEVEARFGEGEIPRPEFWSGFRVVPERIEFWEARPSRLHQRERYDLVPGDPSSWRVRLLYP